jgi:hypothetical protein
MGSIGDDWRCNYTCLLVITRCYLPDLINLVDDYGPMVDDLQTRARGSPTEHATPRVGQKSPNKQTSMELQQLG